MILCPPPSGHKAKRQKSMNEKYIENLQQGFDEALEEGNIQECRAIIEVLKKNLCDEEAQSLLDTLYNTPLEKFSNPSSHV